MDVDFIEKRICRAAKWCAILCLALSVPMILIPMAPYHLSSPERMAWIQEHLGFHLAGWATQMAWVFCFLGVFLGAGIRVFRSAPASALMAWAAAIVATSSFLIEKFITFWSLSIMARYHEIDQQGEAARMADTLFPVWDGTTIFHFTSTLDWLGFAFYAIAGLLIAKPLWEKGGAARIAGVGLFGYAIGYASILILSLVGPSPALINTHIATVSIGLMLAIAALLVDFFKQEKAIQSISS